MKFPHLFGHFHSSWTFLGSPGSVAIIVKQHERALQILWNQIKISYKKEDYKLKERNDSTKQIYFLIILEDFNTEIKLSDYVEIFCLYTKI